MLTTTTLEGGLIVHRGNLYSRTPVAPNHADNDTLLPWHLYMQSGLIRKYGDLAYLGLANGDHDLCEHADDVSEGGTVEASDS